ncbi:MAG: multiubiquitin domain-containing protein [Acidimicrobiales bacterium]
MAEEAVVDAEGPRPDVAHPEIIIDERPYKAPSDDMTGAQLRTLAVPPVGEDRDLWLEARHGEDRVIGDDEVVELEPGMRFFSTPRHINPGSGPAA